MKKGRGYDIEVQKVGQDWMHRKLAHAWGADGELPESWQAVKADPDTERAKIAPSSQRRFRADKRNYIDQYEREDTNE